MVALIAAVVVIFALAFAVSFLFAILISIEPGYTHKPAAPPTIWNMPISKAVRLLIARCKSRNAE